jgi:tetratricopeptide (TPR) repeat protein
MAPRRSWHEWVVAPFRLDRLAEPRDRARVWYDINADRNLCGSYTAAGDLARKLVPLAHARDPALVDAHQLTVLCFAPDLRDRLPTSDETARLLTFSHEGNPRIWTSRLAHGLADFLIAYAALMAPRPLAIAFENVDRADSLDREFLAILLRRANPAQLTLRIGSASEHLDEPLLGALKSHARQIRPAPILQPPNCKLPVTWLRRLARRSKAWQAEWAALQRLANDQKASAIRLTARSISNLFDEIISHLPRARRSALARAYVASDCTSDDPLETRAYAVITPAQRRALHRARAGALTADGQAAATWGAIPFHSERAGDAAPLLAASKRSMHLAYYQAALDWAIRGRKLLDPLDRGNTYGEFTRNILFATMLLGNYPAAEALCDEVLSGSADDALLAHVTYAKAILYARLYPPERRDYDAAKIWIEKSLVVTTRLPRSGTRAVNIAFLHNTMALAEMRNGNHDIAERLLSDAIAYLAKEAPERFTSECAILYHNSARLNVLRDRPDVAIADLTRLLGQQSANAEAYFDRGLLHQRAGRYTEALRDYDAAMRWSPPHCELHFNRGQIFRELGQSDDALAECNRALQLEPDHVETLINRACLLFEQGKLALSRIDIDRGIELAPDAPRLLCLRGLLELRDGALDQACDNFTRAIELKPSLADAWANRGTIFFKRGALDNALADVTRAAQLREDAAILYNRGRILEAQQRWQEAVEEYERAMTISRGDVHKIARRRDQCLRFLRDDNEHL